MPVSSGAVVSAKVCSLARHEILQRRQQERAQPAFLAIGSGERIVRDEMLEESLDHVLRIRRRIAASPNECIRRRPVGLGELEKRSSGRTSGGGVARLQNNRPMRRVKQRTAFLQRSGNRFRKAARCEESALR
jgi:hypothetical protein